MEDNSRQKDIKTAVALKIASGEVSMRPRSYFVLRGIIAGLAVFFTFAAVLYVASFTVFVLRHSGAWFAPAFGLRGAVTLVRSLPWVLVLLGAGLVVVLELLVKRYSFAYRRPLLYSILAVVAVASVGSLAVGRTAFHPYLMERARGNGLGIVGPLYRGYGMHRPHNMTPGTIATTTGTGFVIEDPRGETIEIIVSEETHMPCGKEFEVGDAVVVAGDAASSTIVAEGVCEVNEDFRPGRMRFDRRRGAGEMMPPPGMMQ